MNKQIRIKDLNNPRKRLGLNTKLKFGNHKGMSVLDIYETYPKNFYNIMTVYLKDINYQFSKDVYLFIHKIHQNNIDNLK